MFYRHCKTYLLFVIAMLAFLWLVKAFAKDNGQWKYASPDISAYFNTLMMPDAPAVSCCGEGEVYYTDKQETAPDGSIIAIVTDTRPDEPLHRAHIPVGTRIVIPPNKIRKHPIPNPTGHSFVFAVPHEAGITLYCYESQSLF